MTVLRAATLLASILIAASAACGPSMRTIQDVHEAARVRVGAAVQVGEELSGDVAIDASLAVVRSAVSVATLELDPSSPSFRRRAFIDLVDAANLEGASLILHFWEPSPDDAAEMDAYLRLLLGMERIDEARELAWDMAYRLVDHRPTFVRHYYRSFELDPDYYSQTPQTWLPGRELDEIEIFYASSSLLLKLRDNDATFAAFKPRQDLRHQNYRGEIATYRLCAIMQCAVSIPDSHEVRFHEDDFYALLDEEPGTLIQNQHGRTVEWTEDEFGMRWVVGVAKAWVPGFTTFPIEYDDVWLPYLQVGQSEERLRRLSVAEAVAGFAGRERASVGAIEERQENADAFDLAHQLSDLHVLDYLSNNFDRYQPEIYLGMNCQYDHGQIVSIDNGATFLTHEAHNDHRTRRQVERIELFSRSTVQAIRWMDRDSLYHLLFPPARYHPDEWQRFEDFWTRRERFLAHVDALIAEHGEDAVLIFP